MTTKGQTTKEWKIPVSWSICGDCRVEAPTLKEAMYEVLNSPDILLPIDACMIDDSLTIDGDEDSIREYNNEQKDITEMMGPVEFIEWLNMKFSIQVQTNWLIRDVFSYIASLNESDEESRNIAFELLKKAIGVTREDFNRLTFKEENE